MNISTLRSTKTSLWLAGGAAAISVGLLYLVAARNLQDEDQANRLRIAQLEAEVQTALDTMKKCQAMETKIAKARGELERWSRERPAASVMVWFPARIAQHFRTAGLGEAVTRLNTVKPEPQNPELSRSFWAVDVPIGEEAGALGRTLTAVADLEQAEPHLRVIDFSIREPASAAQRRVAVINCSTLARQ